MIRKTLALSLAAAGIAALTGGCGSDAETTSLNKARFLAEADAICWEVLKRQGAAFQEVLNEGVEEEATRFDPEKQKAFIGEISESVREMVDELSELGAPPGDEAAVRRILEGYERGAAKAEDKPEVFLSGAAFKQADTAAERYGLKKCSEL